MRIKIVGLAFAIAVLAMIGFAYFGTSDTAEAAIHPIVQSECAAQDSATGAGNKQDPPGQVPGHSASAASNLAGVINSNANAANGEGANNCANPSPDD